MIVNLWKNNLWIECFKVTVVPLLPHKSALKRSILQKPLDPMLHRAHSNAQGVCMQEEGSAWEN